MNQHKEKNVRRIVIKELPHFWLYCIFSAVIAFTIQLISLVPPILMQRVIDEAIPSRNVQDVLLSIMWFCVIPICVTSLSTFYKYILAIVCRKFGQELSIKGFRNLIYQPISYFDHENSSELATYCRNEALSYVIFWVIDIPQLISTLLAALIVLGYVAQFNLGIAVFLLLYIPFSFFPSSHFGKKVQGLSKRIIDNNAAMNQIVNDTFKGIRFTKSMALEKLRIKKLEKVNEDSVAIWSRVSVYDNLSGLWVNELSDKLFTGVAFGIAALLTINGFLSLGSIVIILNYTARFIAASKELTHTDYHFKTQLGQYDKLFDILLLHPKEKGGEKPFQFNSVITFNEVSFAYEQQRGEVLRDFNLTVHCGEWLGIMGHSGAGKTTVFDLLMRLYSPQKGNICVDGISIEEMDPEDLRNRITKVSQETFLFPGTVRENLVMVNAQATESDLWNVLEAVRLKEFVKQLSNGLDTEIGENGLLLSGGERQRLGLAQGLLRRSKIILLDEVTANIDADAEATIMRILDDLRVRHHLTILTISHRVDFLACTDRIIVLEEGRVAKETDYSAVKAQDSVEG